MSFLPTWYFTGASIQQPDDGYEVVPDSQFVVSRTAYKDNNSVYHLNGKKVLFREVATLLRGCGIDLDHNRFLILQGEVEHIAMLKPKAQTEHEDGMLEFLEDIIGSSQYKEPIEQLAKQVEELNDQRGEKLNRVKSTEKEKDELEEAKKEAEEFLAMKTDVAKKQHTLYQRYIYECSKHEARSKEKKEEIDGKLKELNSTLADCKGSLNKKLEQHKKGLKAHDKLVTKKDECKTAMASCEQRDIKGRQALKNCKANLKKTQKNLEKEREKLKELEGLPDKHRVEIEEHTQKIKSLEAEKIKEEEILSQILANLRSSTKDLQKEKEEYEGKLIPLKQAASDSASKLTEAKTELDIYEEQCNGAMRKLQEAKAGLKKINEDQERNKRELAKMQEAVTDKKKLLVKTEKDLKTAAGTESKLSVQLRSTRSQVEEAKSALQSHKSRGRVLDSLMKQREQGSITGIHGRLGDLGTIDEKYDVAISTACPGLDDIVVDTMETAVKCVEFLKKHDLGCATFIALDKMEQWRKAAKKEVAIPEKIPRLFDLVRAKDERFSPAFYYSLRDTAVSKDLDQAIRVGLQGRTRHRVVTLDGKLVNPSGTMSGGGTRVMKGRMSSKLQSDVSPHQLKEMETKLSKEELSYKECAENKNRLEVTMKQLKEEINQIEKDLQRIEMDTQLLLDQEKAKQDEISDLEKQKSTSTVDVNHLNKLKQQVDVYQAGYDKAVDAASKVEKEIKRLEDKIVEVGGSRVQQQQSKLKAVNKEIELLTDAITKAKVSIKTAERNTKKGIEKISSLEQEIIKNEQKVSEIKDELTSLEVEAKKIIDEQQEIAEKFKEIEGELLEMKEEVKKYEEEQQQLNNQIFDLQREQEKYSTVMKENQQKIKYYHSEVKKLHLEESETIQMSEEELEVLDRETVEYEITTLEEKLKTMQPNMSAIAEYKQKEEQYLQRVGELDAITASRDATRKDYDDLRKQRLDCFMAGFTVITTKLKEMYQMITLGGDAELELVDSLDPFSEGIVFSVRPPQKSWKNISNLSGGEKTLSSLALVFALHHYKPSPLYVMDEIDAALDFKNVSIVANYIKERTKNAQFIIISLRNNMFELADCLVGIYKTYDATKSVMIHPSKIATTAATAMTTGRQPLAEKNSITA
ncbi:structural maintenance of chromosomes protein 4-like isoform X2 [Dysidea avara]|uniref:structural maintenance of chromosomes protein 4-like isoform X2 n=1 Tax=Dysidea avara TaxID=196820 RepID=UPI003322A104